jgi:hypothetical protein
MVTPVGHPRQAGRRIALHTLIAEQVLGRRLPHGAEVHHVDGNRQNNANANLVICQDRSFHRLLHRRARIVRYGGNPDTESVCGFCGLVKPLCDFYKQRNRAIAAVNYCIPCCHIRRVMPRELWQGAITTAVVAYKASGDGR